MSTEQSPIHIQDLHTLFRARQIVDQLAAEGLGPAIETARAMLASVRSRRQYLQEMLPAGVAYALPAGAETFEVECANARRFELGHSTVPLLWQIMALERKHNTHAIKVIHHDGRRRWEYWL